MHGFLRLKHAWIPNLQYLLGLVYVGFLSYLVFLDVKEKSSACLLCLDLLLKSGTVLESLAGSSAEILLFPRLLCFVVFRAREDFLCPYCYHGVVPVLLIRGPIFCSIVSERDSRSQPLSRCSL